MEELPDELFEIMMNLKEHCLCDCFTTSIIQ
jgi:hypothetical protein